MDVHVLYVEASLPLQPCECHLLRSLLNEKIARGREASHPPTSPGGPVLSVVPALEWSESGFAIGWQAMGACRVFKLRVHGLPRCRLIGRWIKSGRINGLPRRGVRMSFRLLGEPVQQPSLMQADLDAGGLRAEVMELVGGLRAEVAELQSGSFGQPGSFGRGSDGRARYHHWERQQRARRRREEDTAAGVQQGCADVFSDAQTEGRDETDDCPRVAAREEEMDGVRGGLEGVWGEVWGEETLVALPKHAQLVARDGECVFSTRRQNGAEWGKDAADIKARLQHMQALLCAGRA